MKNNKKIEKKNIGGTFKNLGKIFNGTETSYDFRRKKAISENKGLNNAALNTFAGATGTGLEFLNKTMPQAKMFTQPIQGLLSGTKLGETAGWKLGQGVGSFGAGVMKAVDENDDNDIEAVMNMGSGISQGLQGGSRIATFNNDQNTTNWLSNTGQMGEEIFNLAGQFAGQVNDLSGGTPTFKNGGHLLEKYKLLPHSQLNPNFANAHLDGKPVQLEKTETIFRKADGGDFAFSPNLKGKDGITYSDKSRILEKQHSKPFYDKASENTLKYSLEKLAKENQAKIDKNQNSKIPKADEGLNADIIPNESNPLASYKIYNLAQDSLKNANTDTNTPDNDITPLNLFGNNTKGDKMQLAGMLPATMYNLARSMQKPEIQNLYLDKSPVTLQQIKPNLNPIYTAQNVATKAVNENTFSDAVRRNNLMNITSNTQSNIADYSNSVENQNVNLKTQFEQRLTDRNRVNNLQKMTVDDINARNRAAQRMFGATAATNIGQGLTTTGKLLNQGLTNEIQYSTLQQIASNYGLDPKDLAELYRKQGKVIVGFKG